MLARIYKPARTAMQSGKAGQAEKWLLEYEPEVPLKSDPLMGYTFSSDMRRQVKIEFDTCEEAIAYAERYGIPFHLQPDHEAAPKKLSYADNFRFGRPQPWTH
jgi:hypothetical protein